MKKINKIFFVFVLSLLVMPFVTKAEQYTVCQNGCNYSDLDELLTAVEGGAESYIDIDFQDSYEYKIVNHNIGNAYLVFRSTNGSNVNVSGANNNVALTLGHLYLGTYNASNDYVVKVTNLRINETAGAVCYDDNPGLCTVVDVEANSVIDNVSVSGKYTGLGLTKGYQHTVNKYTFSGRNYAISLIGFNQGPYPDRSVTITNSSLANCNCSLLVYDYVVSQVTDAIPLKRRLIAFTDYDIKVDSSQVNCAKYGADNAQIASNPVLFFTSSNTWSKVITKGSDIDSSANVVEGFNSKVIIDLEKAKTISISSTDSVIALFEELKGVNPKDILWRVADTSILKIVDGKVVPLKVGTTAITATFDNTNYTVNYRVTSIKGATIKNPKTGANVFLIIAAVIAACALIFPVALKGSQKQEQQ